MLSRFGPNFTFLPLHQISELRGKLEEMFDDAYSRVTDWTTVRYPFIDVVDTGSEVIVYAEIPGCKKEDLKINIVEGNLILSGERKQVEVSSDASVLKNERPIGSFSRTFNLPEHIDTEKIIAKYDNGVLEIHLPKQEEVRPKHIEVNVQ